MQAVYFANHSGFISLKKALAKASAFSGGEGEIRTLEPCYRLHDFQSCALDQLRDFSEYSPLRLRYDITFFHFCQAFF